MAPKIFLTGVTGYIGGDALFAISQEHPDWELTALVRDKAKGERIAARYPKINIVYGDLDSAQILEEEASKADIVYNFADCNHVASARSIGKGLAAHAEDQPGYLIHTSGTAVLTFEDLREGVIGELREKVYDDWDGVGEVTSLPDDAPHRDVDKVVLDEVSKGSSEKVKTAIVCPPVIYGLGRGEGNQRSMTAYWAAQYFMTRKKGFVVGKGENIWNTVHIQDLSDLYLRLGEAAVSGGGQATWGQEGYYFSESGLCPLGDMLKAIAKTAHEKGFIPSSEPEVLDHDSTIAVHKFGVVAWGVNSRSQTVRARKLLGWRPHRPSLLELVPEIVAGEAKLLGLS